VGPLSWRGTRQATFYLSVSVRRSPASTGSITNKLTSENVPNVVHIYDFPSPSETFAPRLRSILMHANPVLHTRWNPVRKGSLILCCGGSALYTWSDEWVGEGESESEEEMAECIGVPTSALRTLKPFSPTPLNNVRISTREFRHEGREMGTRR
jgi:hypothetical protein